jgi:DNA helicase-2/ATP-dependent DNA helicase PcrA
MRAHDAHDLTARLNPAQREAVLHGDGPLLVLAGAGSGKTRVLTTRIAQLIEHHHLDPREVLAVTFTNKAAGEMRDRLARLLGNEPAGMWCGTFHAIGARMVRLFAAEVGRTRSFTIYDEDDLLGVIKRIMERLRISPKERSPDAIAAIISDARNALVAPQALAATVGDPLGTAAVAVYRELEPTLRQANAVCFDDLLALPVELLERHERILAHFRGRFRHILVDEYQDTNRAQYRLVSLLAQVHQCVTVVGDDDQSIYGWRGADIRNILDFERDFPQARVVRLEENYRSTPEILRLANAAITPNTERRGKTLRATRGSGEAVVSAAALDERDEADWVIDQIQHRRYTGRGRALRDFAILYRTNAQSRALEEALRRHALPYRLVGAVRFYDRREIRDLLAYLKLIANPADDEAFRRAVAVPRRGIGESTIEALGNSALLHHRPILAMAEDAATIQSLRPAAKTALAAFTALIRRLEARSRECGVDELLRDLVESIGFIESLSGEPDGDDRIANVRELISSAAETVIEDGGEVGLTPLDHFLQRASLIAGLDSLDRDADAITLMTLHNAKGLEFPIVFLTGLEEGLFPLARSRESPAQLEEERRLFYVGITRAQDVLMLTHARSRRRNGETMGALPSSFLKGLPTSLYAAQQTLRLRGSARIIDREDLGWGVFQSGGASAGASRRGAWGEDDAEWSGQAGRLGHGRRLGVPVVRAVAAEDESQDTPYFARGERVVHAKFGDGTIADVSGVGRDAKVTVDFDDEAVGRKRLVIAHAGLTRGAA